MEQKKYKCPRCGDVFIGKHSECPNCHAKFRVKEDEHPVDLPKQPVATQNNKMPSAPQQKQTRDKPLRALIVGAIVNLVIAIILLIADIMLFNMVGTKTMAYSKNMLMTLAPFSSLAQLAIFVYEFIFFLVSNAKNKKHDIKVKQNFVLLASAIVGVVMNAIATVVFIMYKGNTKSLASMQTMGSVLIVIAAIANLALAIIYLILMTLHKDSILLRKCRATCKNADKMNVYEVLLTQPDNKSFTELGERILREYSSYAPISPSEVPLERGSYYDGIAFPRLGWLLLSILISVVTLGLCFPVSVYFMTRYDVDHQVVDQKRLKFIGNIGEVYIKFLLSFYLSIITLGVYALFLSYKITRWKVERTSIDGVNKPSIFRGNIYEYIGMTLLNGVFRIITFGIYKPVAVCKKIIWTYSNATYSGEEIVFKGNEYEFTGRSFVWGVLTIITLGIFGIFRAALIRRWQARFCSFKNNIKL